MKGMTNRLRLTALVERYLPRRAGVTATVLLLLASAGFGVVKGGHLDRLTAALSDTRNAIANSAGFRITSPSKRERRRSRTKNLIVSRIGLPTSFSKNAVRRRRRSRCFSNRARRW